jgi:hypothetical protein
VENGIEQHGSNTKIFTLAVLHNTAEVHISCATTLCQALVTFIVTTATENEDKTFAAKFVFELLDVLLNLHLITFSVLVTSSFRTLERMWIEKDVCADVESIE